jgi:hypothetical protein
MIACARSFGAGTKSYEWGSADRDCNATCKLTKKDGSTIEKSYSKKAGKNLKVWMGGEASISGAPLTNPNITSGSCS